MYLDVGVRRFHRFINLCLSEQKHHLCKKEIPKKTENGSPVVNRECPVAFELVIVAVGWECEMFDGQPITGPKVVRVCVASRRIQA